TAVIEGLQALKEPCRVTVYTDSQYVAKAFNEGWIDGWKRRGWKTASKQPVKNRELWEALLKQVDRHDVTFVWVKGHADDALNEYVDRKAVEAIDTLRIELGLK